MLQQGSTRPRKTPAKKKAAQAKRAKTASKKTSPQPKQATPSSTPEQRQQMIEQAAYYIAESRGFAVHDCLDCWLQAEAEIDQQLSQSAG